MEILIGPNGGRYTLKNGRKIYLSQLSPIKIRLQRGGKPFPKSIKEYERRYGKPQETDDLVVGYPESGRGSRLKGERISHPRKREDRERLWNECGERCFLDPKRRKYVVCPKCGSAAKCSCKISCPLVFGARIHSKHWGAKSANDKAERLYAERCEKHYAKKR